MLQHRFCEQVTQHRCPPQPCYPFMSKSSSSALKIILVLAVLVIVFVFVGWLRLSAPDGNPTIQIDSSEIEEDTGTAIDKGKEAVGKMRDEIGERVSEVEDADVEADIDIDAEVEDAK